MKFLFYQIIKESIKYQKNKKYNLLEEIIFIQCIDFNFWNFKWRLLQHVKKNAIRCNLI
jgi:hypothetical protein